MSELTLKDRNLRMVLAKAFADLVADMIKAERVDHLDELKQRYTDEGTKSFDVKLPGGAKIATISLSVSQPSTDVTDEDLLVKWAQENRPDLLTEQVIPAVPAHFVEAVPERREWVLDRKRVTELLDEVTPVDADGGPVATADGLLVDGVEHTAGGDPLSFSVRFVDDGREAVIVAYKSGDLTHLVGGTPLPAIEAAGGDQ